MTPEQIGDYLEHQGATDEEIDEFLEHFGVKGMKWGVRREQRSGSSSPSGQLSGKQALGSVGVGIGAGILARRLTSNPVISGTAAFTGAFATAKLLQKKGSTPVKEVRKPSSKSKPGMTTGQKVGIGIAGAMLAAQGMFTLAAIQMGK